MLHSIVLRLYDRKPVFLCIYGDMMLYVGGNKTVGSALKRHIDIIRASAARAVYNRHARNVFVRLADYTHVMILK